MNLKQPWIKMKRFKLHTQIKKKYSTYMNNFFDCIKGKAWAYE